ncbi:MAG: putative membrane protein [Gammaproteobacteria bacterium]|jgi:hypothetical membrane protein
MDTSMIQKNLIGIIGIAIALVGVGVAIFQDDLRPQPTPVSIQLKDVALEKGAQLLGIDVEEKTPSDWVRLTYFILGFLGIIMGVISWVKKENHRVSATALSLGIVAVAWQYVLIGVGFAVFIMIIGSFS